MDIVVNKQGCFAMDNELPMFRVKEPQEVAIDYCEVTFLYYTKNYIPLNAKLRDIERRYRTELRAYNMFRPVRYIFSLDEQAWECMDFLQKLFLSIGLTKICQGNFCQ